MSFTRIIAITTVCLTAFGGFTSALAQSTGNPKGTVAPPASDAPKAGATSGPSTADGAGSSGRLTSEQGPASARGTASRSPGTGTAGGLPKRTPAEGADASRSDPHQGLKPPAIRQPRPSSRNPRERHLSSQRSSQRALNNTVT